MQSCNIHVTYNWAVVQRIHDGTVGQARDEPRQQKEFHSCISTHCRRAHALCTPICCWQAQIMNWRLSDSRQCYVEQIICRGVPLSLPLPFISVYILSLYHCTHLFLPRTFPFYVNGLPSLSSLSRPMLLTCTQAFVSVPWWRLLPVQCWSRGK
jgi:hypothetical protein